ncbi:MAG: hypothetical protein ABEI74_01335 [Candidatus Pacearchaeota archaeon]
MKKQIDGIVSKAETYLEEGRNKHFRETLEEDKQIAKKWIYGISHLNFGVIDFAMNLPKQQKLKKHDEVNESWNHYEQIIIPGIYNQLERNLEKSYKNLKKAQKQPSTYEVPKNHPDFSEELLEKNNTYSGNHINSKIDDIGHITAQSINESTGDPVKIEGYETPFFKKPEGEPTKVANTWGKSTRK